MSFVLAPMVGPVLPQVQGNFFDLEETRLVALGFLEKCAARAHARHELVHPVADAWHDVLYAASWPLAGTSKCTTTSGAPSHRRTRRPHAFPSSPCGRRRCTSSRRAGRRRFCHALTSAPASTTFECESLHSGRGKRRCPCTTTCATAAISWLTRTTPASLVRSTDVDVANPIKTSGDADVGTATLALAMPLKQTSDCRCCATGPAPYSNSWKDSR